MNLTRRFRFLGLIAGLHCVTAQPVLAESIEIPGTGDGMAILRELAKAFTQANPEDRVLLPPSVGSSGGIKAVGLERARLGRVAREIKEREQPYGLSYLPIARFPVVFFVNQDVCVTDLSADQINDIYRGKITNWKQVGGNDGRIRVIRREEGDSSLRRLRATFPGFDDVSITKFSKVTPTTQKTIDAVANTSGSIAFGPYSDVLAANLYILAINGKAPLDDAYPSYGVLALIYKSENKSGLVSDFIDFVLSPSGANAIRAANASPYRQ